VLSTLTFIPVGLILFRGSWLSRWMADLMQQMKEWIQQAKVKKDKEKSGKKSDTERQRSELGRFGGFLRRRKVRAKADTDGV
jgi:hypothetical protein